MTSSSLRKHPTTRQNTPRTTEHRRLTLLLACIGLLLTGIDVHAAPWQELFGIRPPDHEAKAPGEAARQPRAGNRAAMARPVADIERILAAQYTEATAFTEATPYAETVPYGDDVVADVSVSTSSMTMTAMRQPSPGAATAASTAAEDGQETDASDTGTAGCATESKACQEALEQLRLDRLSEIDLDIKVDGVAGNDYPCECRLEGETFVPRRFATTTFTWKAAGYCHKPLYFEQWNFERYGHSYGWAADPFISAAHFFGTLPILPYKMGVELPWECVYPVGYYRPGDCAPWTVPAFPISVRGMAVEAATVTGLVFLLP